MKRFFSVLAASAALVLTASAQKEAGFVSIFDGKTLDGWKVGDNPGAFKVEDGAIVANGDCAHLFYAGKEGEKFKDFELRLDVMTKPNSNGGVFISSVYQEKGWPSHGYEVQVNNTQSDWKKSGGLYNYVDNKEPFKDNEWMKYVIRVKKGKVNVSVNGKDIVKDYEPEEGKSKLEPEGGTFAIQAHDKGSTTLYKNIRVKKLD
ncbi:3-keto-disaccharide hydrolase [Luteolibacter luteus]|uniref:DUF1080 domain-containing protein n=1 Tax=Luteolibacter luteus TaxID=2728835 RepID=A0A858RFA9_9BACT|nr:DUF1080 domain-containing protein [Luteolibacter luteus]QJE95291.1 DUF1080 domain-containing protein [Luteolibacter luteus]